MIISTLRTTREIMNSRHVDLVGHSCHSAHDRPASMLQHECAEACPGLRLPRATMTSMQMAESGCGQCIVHTRTVGPLIYIHIYTCIYYNVYITHPDWPTKCNRCILCCVNIIAAKFSTQTWSQMN